MHRPVVCGHRGPQALHTQALHTQPRRLQVRPPSGCLKASCSGDGMQVRTTLLFCLDLALLPSAFSQSFPPLSEKMQCRHPSALGVEDNVCVGQNQLHET